ncbi:hypothetical protein BGX28_009983, partial [Mortierella sp. GBA30]
MKMFAFKRRHSSLLVLALALFIVSTATLALAANGKSKQPMCGSKEVFRKCKIASEPSCKDPTTRRCVKDRKGACFCKNGLVRDENGRCVLKKFCRAVKPVKPVKPVETRCGKNEVLGDKPDCQLTCGQSATVCNQAIRLPGCICKPGFVRKSKEDFRCVPKESCDVDVQKRCGVNEVYGITGTGRGCQATCDPHERGVC